MFGNFEKEDGFAMLRWGKKRYKDKKSLQKGPTNLINSLKNKDND